MDRMDGWLNVKEMSDRIAMMLSDCAFLVGSTQGEYTRFDAHKLVLASASPVFHAMFYGELKETKTPIQVTDMEGKTFGAMLNYIYTEKVPDGTTADILLLWAGAEKYQIPPLISSCVEILTKALKPENVYDVLEYALLFSNRELEDKCMEAFGYKATLLLPGFEKLPLDFIQKLLDLDSLKGDAREMDLYNALERWAKTQCKRMELPQTTEYLRRVTGDAVKKIRFLTMSLKEFASGVSPASLLLPWEESYRVLVNILNQTEPLTSGTQLPLPLGFCTSRTARFTVPLPVIIRHVRVVEVDLKGVNLIVKNLLGSNLSFSLPVDAVLVLFKLSICSACNFKAYLFRSDVLLAGVQVETASGSDPCVTFGSLLVLERGVKYSLHIEGYDGPLYSITNPKVPFGDNGHLLLSDVYNETVVRQLTFLTE